MGGGWGGGGVLGFRGEVENMFSETVGIRTGEGTEEEEGSGAGEAGACACLIVRCFKGRESGRTFDFGGGWGVFGFSSRGGKHFFVRWIGGWVFFLSGVGVEVVRCGGDS